MSKLHQAQGPVEPMPSFEADVNGEDSLDMTRVMALLELQLMQSCDVLDANFVKFYGSFPK